MAIAESYVQPFRLYRYRPLRDLDRELEAIEQNYLYCSTFTDLNDPMEGVFSSSRKLREREDYRETRRLIVQNKSVIRMCSFSEVRDNELMWAHYADQFRGICIAYSFSKLLSHLPENVSLVRMFYNETEPTIRRTRKEPVELAKMILSCKNFRWLYEREWRMFSPQGRTCYRNKACITDVYLGFRIADANRITLTNRLKQLKIRTRNMTIDKYSMDFRLDS